MRFDIKCGIITGGGTGIGRAIAEKLVAEGGRVAIVSRRPEVLSMAAQKINPQKVFPIPGDVNDPTQAGAITEQALAILGKLDFLVNNAGIMQIKHAHDITPEEFDREIATNFRGNFFMTQAAIRHFRQQKAGAILNLASVSGLIASPKMAVYGASKAAMIHLTQSLALEYAKEGIRINCICPGTVDTGLMPKALAAMVTTKHPLGRLGTVQEIAALAAHVLSEDSSWMTGSVITLDGGVSL